MTFRIISGTSPALRGAVLTLLLVGAFALGAFAQDKRPSVVPVEHLCITAPSSDAALTTALNERGAKGWRLVSTSMRPAGMRVKALACFTR